MANAHDNPGKGQGKPDNPGEGHPKSPVQAVREVPTRGAADRRLTGSRTRNRPADATTGCKITGIS